MVAAVQKITLSSSRDIPFNKLLLSQANVRRVKAGVSIEELAEDIARRGLLQGLRAKHPDMVLLHGGNPKDAEKIASRWADHRGVSQVSFKPDWSRHGKAAPFKRNDAMLDVLPIGVVVFPGTGIQDNLAAKARKLGIPVFDFRTSGA